MEVVRALAREGSSCERICLRLSGFFSDCYAKTLRPTCLRTQFQYQMVFRTTVKQKTSLIVVPKPQIWGLLA